MESNSPILEGTDTTNFGIRRRSIEGHAKIPNVAVFLKRTTLEFLQIIFSQRAPGSLRYDPEDTQTDIQISDVHAVDLKTIGLRPQIVASRGPLSWQGLGLGGSGIEKLDMATGKQTINDLLTGSVAFSCISREGIEAEQIAHLVFNSFKLFKSCLSQHGFFTIKSLNLGGEQLIETEGADDRTSLVPVYVTAQIQDRWSLEPTVERSLKKIIVKTLFTP